MSKFPYFQIFYFQAKVTTNHLEFMATGLDMYNWQTYMRALGLHDSDLEDIRYNFRDNAYEQRYQALLFWRNKNGLEASPESLITAALRRNQRLLAEKFCKKFKGFEHLLRKGMQEGTFTLRYGWVQCNMETKFLVPERCYQKCIILVACRKDSVGVFKACLSLNFVQTFIHLYN